MNGCFVHAMFCAFPLSFCPASRDSQRPEPFLPSLPDFSFFRTFSSLGRRFSGVVSPLSIAMPREIRKPSENSHKTHEIQIHQSVPIENHFQMSLIQVICTDRNSLCPKQQPMMESKSILIHSHEMLFQQSVPIENHFQMSLIQVICTDRNSLCPEQ
jgi:hypothetical protein